MGRVTDRLVDILARHLREHSVVVWYDPEGQYERVVETLSLGDVTILRHKPNSSLFRLRHQLDPFLEELGAARVMAYIAQKPEDLKNALVEADQTGVALFPGAPGLRNTRLEVLARPVLGGDVPANATLEELDQLAERPRQDLQLLALVFGTSDTDEIALRFLADAAFESKVQARGALEDLRELLTSAHKLGAIAFSRQSFESHVFASAVRGHARSLELLHAWRDSERRRDSYVAAAEAADSHVPIRELAPADLIDCDAVPSADSILLTRAEESLAQGDHGLPLSLWQARHTRFWARQDPRIAASWAAVEAVACVLREAERVAGELAAKRWDLAGLTSQYARDVAPWCELDRRYRVFLRLGGGDRTEAFDRALAVARRRYEQVATALAEAVHEALARGLQDVARQQDVYASEVAPRLGAGRVAYIWVDALRYEMVLDLLRGLPGAATLRAALAVVPTITPLGMAALLPGAEGAFGVGAKGARLAAVIGDKKLVSRDDRVNFFAAASEGLVAIKLADLTSGKRSAKENAANAPLLLVTSQEIDQLAETDEPLAFQVLDDVVKKLRIGINTLATWGFSHVVLAADHGYLIGERTGEDALVQNPGGETLDLHRRVWIGRGGITPVGAYRYTLSSFGISGDYDVVVPAGLSAFRAGGGLSYFHGGTTLQEMVIPVLTVRLTAPRSASTERGVFHLGVDTRGIRTRAFSATVAYQSLLQPVRRVRVVGRLGQEVVTSTVAAEYGHDPGTQDVAMEASRTNVVTLVLNRDVDVLTIELYDADTGKVLASAPNIAVRLGI